MKQTDEKLYQCYQDFVHHFILEGKSYLTVEDNNTIILSKDNIEDILKRYVDNPDFTEGKDFKEKIKEQFKNASYQVKLLFAHAEWLWAMAVTDIANETKIDNIKRTIDLKNDEDKVKQDIVPNGFGSAGMYHKTNKYHEIKFIIHLFKYLLEKYQNQESRNLSDINKDIEIICNTAHYDNDKLQEFFPKEVADMVNKKRCAMYNILTHLAFPDKYERIASDENKERIVNTFSILVDDKVKEWEGGNTDEQISIIRKRLTQLSKDNNFDFYKNKYIYNIWNSGTQDNLFNEVQALNYKKAIILYGPPGTSKTYSAKKVAHTLITQHYLSKPDNVKEYFENLGNFEKDVLSHRIHRLQLHPNYSYEDFIVGIQFKDNETKIKKGYFLKTIEKIKEDEYPHVIILDEINRVDLSRLFGELFSAIENRDEIIDLPIGEEKLNIEVPNNLYIIGTMNEIDFSLERIDFALRRRFVWYFYGYNSHVLLDMLTEGNEKQNPQIKSSEIEQYVERCNKLNSYITKDIEELGKQYQIGHTFFADIVEIHKTFIKSKPISLLKKDRALSILWSISILPMIEAYLGNMDSSTRTDKIKKMEVIFFNGK